MCVCVEIPESNQEVLLAHSTQHFVVFTGIKIYCLLDRPLLLLGVWYGEPCIVMVVIVSVTSHITSK